MSEESVVCFICGEKVLNKVRHVGAEGRKTLIKAAIIRGDFKNQQWFENDSIPVPDVHHTCYRTYSNHERVLKQIQRREQEMSRYFVNIKVLVYMFIFCYFLFGFSFYMIINFK